MKKLNNIFQLLTALFFGVGLVYFLTYERLWSGNPESGHVVSWILVGLVVFLISWGVSFWYVGSLNRKVKNLELEKNELKAMVFDMEKGVKIDQLDKKTETQPDDKEASVIKPRENFK
jgi:uncharacterized membrane protein (DUF485 family)